MIAAVVLGLSGSAHAFECADLWSWVEAGCRHVADTYQDGDNALLVSGYSWHTPWTWTSERRAMENSDAWGGGLARSREMPNGDTENVYFLVFDDSHRQPQYNVGYSWSTYWLDRDGIQPGLGFTALIHSAAGYRQRLAGAGGAAAVLVALSEGRGALDLYPEAQRRDQSRQPFSTSSAKSISSEGRALNVLVVGGGGREHALAWKIAQSPRVAKVFVAPGNAGTALEPELTNVAVTAIPELLDLARSEQIDLTVVGPETPLAAGIVDAFRAAGLRIFGPDTRRRPARKLQRFRQSVHAAARAFRPRPISRSLMRPRRTPTSTHAVRRSW